MARPLGACLVVILCALLLERILRLIDLVAAHGGPLGPVLQMAINLIPHYLGLALPAAFFISIFIVVARLADEAELDAMMAMGCSLRRLEMPFGAIAVVLALISLGLYGYLQPYTRYAYRAILGLVTETGWAGNVPQGVFVDAGDGMTIFADAVDVTGTRMRGMFIHEQKSDVEIVTAAERGELKLDMASGMLTLRLESGRQLHNRNSRMSMLDFEHYSFTRDFSRQAFLFRPRGADEREMTLNELYAVLSIGGAPPGTLRAEFHARLVRAASILVLPFFAVPMGLAAKRGRRGPGLVIAAAVLVIYHHSLQFGEGLVDLGRADPLFSIWGPFALFTAFCLLVTARSDAKAGAGPLERTVGALESGAAAIVRLVPLRWRAP